MEIKQAVLLKWIDDVFKKAKVYQQVLVAAGVGAIVLGSVVFGYAYYKNKVRAAAYKDFMSAMQSYDGVIKNKKVSSNYPSVKQFESESDKWAQTEQAFRQGYQNYKNTELAPAFLAFQAEALLNLGKVDDAIKILKDVVAQVKSEEIKDSYKVKIALISMDKKDEKAQSEALNELIAIANNDGSVANEVALYQVGSYFWNQKKYNEAKDYWQRLLVKTTAKSGQVSVFAGEVRDKLSLITSESL
ncbi:MAG: hypothetical protein V1646_04550 [bacterium]